MRVGRRFWLNKGFLSCEASAFKNITTEAIQDSRYIQVMIETRMRFKRDAVHQGMTVRDYYHAIRQVYVKRGLATTAKALEFDGVAGRRLAFDFFNAYKDYAIRDRTGKVIETPRKKAKVSKRPITKRGSINQLIKKDQEEIKHYQFRLKFEKDEYTRASYQRSIDNYKRRIATLKVKAKQL